MADENDIAALGLAIETGPMATFVREGERMVAAAGNVDRAAKLLTTTTQALGAAALTAATSTERQASSVATGAKSYDLADAAYRKAMGSLNALAGAENAAAKATQAHVSAYANAARQADGFARLAQQKMMETGVSRSRELMSSVEASTASIKAMYTGTAATATAAAERIATANRRIASSSPGMGMGGMGGAGATGAMNAQQRLNLGYQLNDIFVQASMGTNPLMIAAQQGPQITQIFGGLRNTLGRIPTAGLVGGGAALAGVAGLAGLNSLAGSQDQVAEQERRFTALLGPGSSVAKMYKDISTAASAASVSTEQMTTSVEGFAKASTNLGASRSNIIDIAKSFEQLAKLGGANEGERGSGQTALSSMLKASVVSGEQLQTVLSNVPKLAEQIAAGLGVSVTQLRLMTNEGELTNRKVFDAILSRSTEINDQFSRMPKSVGDLFTSIGNDLGSAIKNLADSIPLVNKYREALELAARAAKGLKEAGAPESNASIIARTNDLFSVTGTGNTAEAQAARAAGMQKALEERAQALKNLHAQMRMDEENTASAIKKANDEIIVSASTTAKEFDTLNSAYQKNNIATEAMEKALEALNSGLTSLSGEEAARQIDLLTRSLERAREEARNLDPAMKVINDINQRNQFRSIDPSQAGMERQTQVRELVKGGSNEQEAITAAMAAQQEKAADLVVMKQREAEASTLLLEGVRKGTAATIEAKVQALSLAFAWANVGDMANASADQIKMVADYTAAVRTALTNEETISKLQGGANAAKQYTDELAGLAAQMKIVEQGSFAMKRVEAEVKAARADNGTGKLQLQVFDEKQALADKTMLVNLGQEISLTKELAAAAGDVAKQKQIQLDYDIKKAQLNAAPAARPEIDTRMREEAAANQARDLAEGAAQMEKQVTLTKQQTDLINASNADYAAQLSMLNKKNELLQKGVDIDDANAQRQIAAAGDQARANIGLDKARDAADQTKKIWQNAYDNIQSFGGDTFYNIFTGATVNGLDAATSLKNIFLRAFADIAAAAIIRPLIQPIFNAAQGLGIMPSGVGGAGGGIGGGGSGGGGMFGGLGNITGSIGNWLSSPISGAPSAASYAGVMPGMTGAEAQSYFGGLSGNGGIGGALGNTTWGQGLGAVAGLGMGAYQLATSKSTAGTIGGIASMVGGAVSLIPGVGQIAGPIISILGSVLPGLFESKPEPPTNRAISSLNFSGGKFVTGGGSYGMEGADLSGLGTSLGSIFKSAGITSKDSAYGLSQQSYSKGDFSNATTFVTGPGGQQMQWGQSSDPKMQQQAMDTGAAHVAHQIMMELDSGISGNMRQALNQFGLDNLQHAFSMDELSTVVNEMNAFDEAVKKFGDTTPDVVKQIIAVSDSFDGLYETAKKYALGAAEVAKIDAERNRQMLLATKGFTDNIDQQFMSLTNPLQATFVAISQAREKDLVANDEYVARVVGYVDRRAQIEAVYRDQEIKAQQDYNEQRLAEQEAANAQAVAAAEATANALKQRFQTLSDLIAQLTPGGALSGLGPREQLEGLRATYEASRAQLSANPMDQDVISKFASDSAQLAAALKDFYGSSDRYSQERNQLIADAERAQQETGGSALQATPVNDPGPANTNTQFVTLMGTVERLTKTLEDQKAQNSALLAKFERLIGPNRAV